jgi:nicotinate phosphoribosyltransferase
MIKAHLEHGDTRTAVFEFFVRKFAPQRGFLMAAGLEQVLDFLENLRFSAEELDWLARGGRLGKHLLDHLAPLRFTGDVHAMPNGTVFFFANKHTLEEAAPLPEAQLVEARLINVLRFQSLIATKAARMVLSARGRLLVDFGPRRAHAVEAGLLAACASFIAAFVGTATMLAGKLFGIPIYATMAHSFIQAFDSEEAAFAPFARSRPENLILLIDRNDTEKAARTIVSIAPRRNAEGIAVRGVGLDSGDLISLSKSVRRIDDGGLQQVTIFASAGPDAGELTNIVEHRAPIDGFGVGTSLATTFDEPALDCAYKLQEYAGLPRRKRLTPQPTLADTAPAPSASKSGYPRLCDGRRPGATYPVEVAHALQRLAAEVDHHLACQERMQA